MSKQDRDVIFLRVQPSLKETLKSSADKQGLSLQQYVVGILTFTIAKQMDSDNEE